MAEQKIYYCTYCGLLVTGEEPVYVDTWGGEPCPPAAHPRHPWVDHPPAPATGKGHHFLDTETVVPDEDVQCVRCGIIHRSYPLGDYTPRFDWRDWNPDIPAAGCPHTWRLVDYELKAEKCVAELTMWLHT